LQAQLTAIDAQHAAATQLLHARVTDAQAFVEAARADEVRSFLLLV
jgi:hypothetical protein